MKEDKVEGGGGGNVYITTEKKKTGDDQEVTVRIKDTGQGVDNDIFLDCLLNSPQNLQMVQDLDCSFARVSIEALEERFGLKQQGWVHELICI